MGKIYEVTFWSGTAFKCQYSSNAIILLHSQFNSSHVTCNDGTIIAKSISLEGNNYTSQLNITVTPDIVGKTTE